jgi:hypothetical protein
MKHWSRCAAVSGGMLAPGHNLAVLWPAIHTLTRR